jgi:hypothetical protein
MKTTMGALLGAALLAATSAAQPAPAVAPKAPDWVETSNAHARVLLDVAARFQPEGASEVGLAGLDEQTVDLGPDLHARSLAAVREARAELARRLEAEKDPRVKQDLAILVEAADRSIKSDEIEHRTELPYRNVSQTVFRGLRGLLDPQVAPERRKAALVRLRRYAGLAPGTRPITELAMERTRERLAEASLLGPARAEVERDLGNVGFFMDGIAKLFTENGLTGWEPAHAALVKQMEAYTAFVRAEVLPRARTDFRLPRETYLQRLTVYGVDAPPEVVRERARVAFMEIRNEMRALAPLVAREKGFAATDYVSVLRELKKKQITGPDILPHYQARLAALEDIIRRERVVTLPTRAARIRLASEAESAQSPAPHMRPPRLLGNTGEQGEFVLPLRIPGPNAGEAFDDFTFDAASWTLTVHEGRPGHEMQFASVVENGVSTARAIYAFNSVNVEGWALYAEAEMKPYLPLDGQLVSLQHRLLRAARAFLDPELQLGLVTPEAAGRLLQDEVVVSPAMARQEVERYTFRAPGQATSYFHGYTRWLQLRSEVESLLGPGFDRQRYHDFLLAQGLLPPDVLRRAVTEDFVAAERARLGSAK